MKKFVVILSVLILTCALCSMAFAAGESLSHDGTAKNNYYTDGSVPQKNDTRLDNQSLLSNYPGCGAYKVRASVGKTSTDAGYGLFTGQDGMDLYLKTSSSVRNVHLQFVNQGAYVGVSVRTIGLWILRAS